MIENIRKINKNLLSPSKTRFFIWFIAFIVFYLIYYISSPNNPIWRDYLTKPLSLVFYDVISVLLFSIIISETSLAIDRSLNKSLPWYSKPQRRLFFQTFFQIIVSISLVILIYLIFYNISNSASIDEYIQLGHCIATNIIISLIIGGINTGNYLLKNWSEATTEATQLKLEASEHKQAAIEAELQTLKLQIDPHFIFNNLSVLSELILENQQQGYEFTENFAKVYRYMLVNSKKDVLTLEEELKFLQSYIFLIKKRIGSAVLFTINVDKTILMKKVPSLALQFLVENAIKHNQTSKNNPLHIEIFNNNLSELVVSNDIIPLVNKTLSSGIGLNNITYRYKFLSDLEPKIVITDDSYTVKIPLL